MIVNSNAPTVNILIHISSSVLIGINLTVSVKNVKSSN